MNSFIRKCLDLILTPLARQMEGVRPNTLTAASLALGLLAALSFWLTRFDPGFFAAAAVLIALSGVADSLDGILARVHGRVTALGDFFDHVSDRLVEAAVFVGLSFSPGASPKLGLVTTVLILLHSSTGTQVAASFGSRYYGGAGRAELVISLVVFAVIRAVFPTAVIRLWGFGLGLTDLFFGLTGAATLAALVHRLRRAAVLAKVPRDG